MAKPPVCKLMDFGKFKYEAALKERESRKNQTHTIIKEMKLRPKIDQHDYETKKGHVERFLKAGDKVKITIMFRGREQSRPELGLRLLARLAEDVEELGYVEANPKQDGRNMLMVLAPHGGVGCIAQSEAESEVTTTWTTPRASTGQRAKTTRTDLSQEEGNESPGHEEGGGLMPKRDAQRCRSDSCPPIGKLTHE